MAGSASWAGLQDCCRLLPAATELLLAKLSSCEKSNQPGGQTCLVVVGGRQVGHQRALAAHDAGGAGAGGGGGINHVVHLQMQV